jgi:putative restriction endonuclease
MDAEAVVNRFRTLSTWSRGQQRAPHKPLLVLYALARWARGETDDVKLEAAENELTTLLKEFGPPRKSHHPEYPFWRLQNDGVWVVHADGKLKPRLGNTNPPRRELIARHARGGFSADVKAALRKDPSLVNRIASRLLENHFPESLHPDILNAVGLSGENIGERRRDPTFRLRVLTAYEYRCAVCGFDVRLGSVSIALDAAHVQWHQAGGPDQENNGVALCVLHHKFFDLGAFTVAQERIILVSDQAYGSAGFKELLMAHHGKAVRAPQRPEWELQQSFLDWHFREVFKGSARHRG